MTATVTPYQARQSMGGARHREHELADAYEAGRAGEVPWDEYRDHRADPEDDHQKALRASFEQGRGEVRSDRRRQTARRVAGRARSVGGQSSGYLARAGRSLADRSADIPTPSGGGTFLGILVAMVALVLLFVALNHAGAVASVFTGLTGAAKWLISPSTLPI